MQHEDPEPVGESHFSATVEHRMQHVQAALVSTFFDEIDGSPPRVETWRYARGRGGGRTCVLEDGNVFEKAGINWSAIAGEQLPDGAVPADHPAATAPFFATGVSVVMHPHNPHVPTIHMNVRYFELRGDDAHNWWFGGGIDLTPFYPQRAQVITFHRELKALCDTHDPAYYEEFKPWCDRYFRLPHREEMRGVGGIFFDRLNDRPRERLLAFVEAVGLGLRPLYQPIVEANRHRDYGPRERDFQLLRRGRYAEFNLLWDRGTRFGITSGGRTQSILMSLPPLARWPYAAEPDAGSEEATLSRIYFQPREWAQAT